MVTISLVISSPLELIPAGLIVGLIVGLILGPPSRKIVQVPAVSSSASTRTHGPHRRADRPASPPRAHLATRLHARPCCSRCHAHHLAPVWQTTRCADVDHRRARATSCAGAQLGQLHGDRVCGRCVVVHFVSLRTRELRPRATALLRAQPATSPQHLCAGATGLARHRARPPRASPSSRLVLLAPRLHRATSSPYLFLVAPGPHRASSSWRLVLSTPRPHRASSSSRLVLFALVLTAPHHQHAWLRVA